ncbi:MAG: PCYCGC motif-containing lipoprotein [Candidatus Methanoperedens sp.]|nr:PCYCGC motif-containing lipoprotein [Candidatus Methanoperedens sp.]MCZ7370981.1 PCYCGC motif-containing lipoprotein [Candidatus Methanoperedens sp.]
MKPEKKEKNVKAKREKISKKKGNSTLIIGIVAVIVLAGIAYAVFSAGPATKKTQDTGVKLPSFAYTNPITLKAYKYATEHPEILEQIPCYCGCGSHGSEASDYRPHRFLRDCYINDNWQYDEHASFCDVCVGEATKVQEYLAEGKTLTEARALIDQEYSKIGAMMTNTPPVSDNYIPILKPKLAGTLATPAPTPTIDLSALSLPDNFRSLSDGLKLIPPGITWAYFANLKQGIGVEQKFMHDTNFYGIPIIGMLNSEYPDGSWVELHDVGKANANVISNAGADADNIVSTRPFIFDSKDKTNSVQALFKNSATNANAYDSFKSILEKVDDENAGFAKINTTAPPFADASYIGIIKSETGILGEVKGEIAFRIKDNSSVPLAQYNELKSSSLSRGFKSYEVSQENNILIIKTTSNLNNFIAEATQQYGIDISVFG